VPAGACVIVDIQRGKYAISRAHKFSQSGESGPLHARGSGVTYVQARAHSHAEPDNRGFLGNPGIQARQRSRYREEGCGSLKFERMQAASVSSR